jgi:hypothetical protein
MKITQNVKTGIHRLKQTDFWMSRTAHTGKGRPRIYNDILLTLAVCLIFIPFAWRLTVAIYIVAGLIAITVYASKLPDKSYFRKLKAVRKTVKQKVYVK